MNSRIVHSTGIINVIKNVVLKTMMSNSQNVARFWFVFKK